LFIEVRKLRLDPCSPALRGRLEGRARFHGFCKWLSLRARPRTARTSRSPEKATGPLHGSGTKVAFRPVQPPELRRARGREHRVSALPTTGLLPVETSPRPRSLRAPRVTDVVHFPAWRNGGRERRRRRRARLHCLRRERAVRRLISAKKSDVHWPEGPSVFRPFAGANGRRLSVAAEAARRPRRRLFHRHGHPCEGRSRGARQLGPGTTM
jgi:hypothetical protein